MKIQVSDYNYKSAPGRNETGFIAQQLNTVIPDAVTPGGENPVEKPWTVDYSRVTPVLVKAIQEQQAKLAALESENRALKERLASMNGLAARLEAMERVLAVAPATELRTVSVSAESKKALSSPTKE